VYFKDLVIFDAFGTRFAPLLRESIRREGRRRGTRIKGGQFDMTNEIDLHVGKRLRRRRRLLGLTQQQLAESVGIRFQQIQKYECGANRVSASRLFELAESLDVPVQYFYEGLSRREGADEPEAVLAADILSQKETMDLIRAYYRLGERPRKRLLELAKSLEPGEPANDAA
jgi:transcriptional regulator with XRE-family HTH domain